MPIDRDRIRELRLEKGWSAPELARRSGVSRSMVYLIESGGSGGTERTAKKLADALGVRVRDIWTFGDD